MGTGKEEIKINLQLSSVSMLTEHNAQFAIISPSHTYRFIMSEIHIESKCNEILSDFSELIILK